MNMITLESKNVNKKICETTGNVDWDFDEEFFRAEEDFYAHKYNFAENVVYSSLQRKIDKLVFEFGLGAGRVSQIINNVNVHNFDNVNFVETNKINISTECGTKIANFVQANKICYLTGDGKLSASFLHFKTSDKIPYPEPVDKYSSLGGKLGKIVGWLNEHGHEEEARAVAVCGGKVAAVDLRCRAEHRFAKQIFCGRQYCPRCGEKESAIHQQRYSRSWDRLMWAPALGKVVLTVPEELRDDFKSADMLGKLHRLSWQCVKEVLGRELNIDGAMTTVHQFGDRKDRDKFHPHSNVTFPICPGVDLVDENGKIIKEAVRKALVVSKETLKALRDKWYDMLEKLTGKTISLTEDGRERKNAYYGFRITDAQKAHWVKYVLRPTVGAERFLEQDDDLKEFVAASLVGFHNVRWYGRLSNRMFPKYRKEYLENTSFYQKFLAKKQARKVRDFKYCPICHGRLKVRKHKGKVEILENIHKTWHELSLGFWCDEVTYQILVRKGLVGANGKFIDSS